jgi:hypothetical protein
MTVTGRRGSEGVTLVYASRSRRLASGAAGADRFLSASAILSGIGAVTDGSQRSMAGATTTSFTGSWSS